MVNMAYAWGKWIALRRDHIEKAMQFYCEQRPRKNWAILKENDEWALRYQRCQFRLRRAMRAVGAWGMTGYGTFDETAEGETAICGVKFPVRWEAPDQLSKRNFADFDQSYRQLAVQAKQKAEDKRDPRAAFDDVRAEEEARAYIEEMESIR